MKQKFLGYSCSLCGAEYAPHDVTYLCPHDGGNLNVVMDFSTIRREITVDTLLENPDPSLWRYLPLLPVSDPSGTGTPLRSAGGTPLYRLGRLAQSLGMQDLWVKDESRNPTASFKDRASAVVVARALETGAQTVVTASTGNAGAALAGMAAAVGMPAVIFAPENAPPAKVAQLLVYGAQVILVEGTYDDAFDLTVQAAGQFGWYCRNTGYNPFTAEGKKTATFEIWEGLLLRERFSRVPVVFVSVGDGNIISGIHKGFKDLEALGWLDQIPRLFAVQAQGSAAVANAFREKTETITPVSAKTIADSISVDLPRDGVRALRAVRETGGDVVVVDDDAILRAVAELGVAGIFAEPAGAAAYAGLRKAVETGQISPEDPVIVLNTGSGLKDTRAAMQAVEPAPVIKPSLDALRDFLSHSGVK